jgi:hypothetical protein
MEVEEDLQPMKEDKKETSLKETKKNIDRIVKDQADLGESAMERKEADSFDQQMREKVRKSRDTKVGEPVVHDPSK